MKRLLLLFVCAVVANAPAAVVYDQPHNGSGTILPSSRYLANGTDYDQFVWDSFSVPTAQAVTEIRWRGGHQPDMAYWGGDIVSFRVSIYASIPGNSQPYLGAQYPAVPATLAAYDTGGLAGQTNGGVFGGATLYDYRFVLPTPFQAASNTVYWVQIEAEQANGIPDWGFAAGTGNGSHFRRIPGQADYYFQIAPGDAAFSIVTSDGPVRTIVATADPAEGGTIDNAGLYPDGSAAPLVATPLPGYAFVNWTENGGVVSTAAAYTFTVGADRTLVAHFAAGSTITTASSPPTGGTTDGGGSFVNGSTRTVEAVPAANFRFVNWTENGVPVSTNASYTFTVGSDRDLTAQFVALATNLGLVFLQPPAVSNAVLLSSYLAPDGNVDGMEYRFEKFVSAADASLTQLTWRGAYVGNNAPGNPVVEFIIKIYASTANGFYPDLANPYLKKYTITGDAAQTPAEVVGGVQFYDYSVTLPTSFAAAAGVPYWVQIEASQLGYPLTWGLALGSGGDGAHYRRVGNSYYGGSGDLAVSFSTPAATRFLIEAQPSSTNGGTVAGQGIYALDATVRLVATAAAGHAFVNWTQDGVIVGSSATNQFPATSARSLIAHFVDTYALNLSSASTTMGTVSGSGTYLAGSGVTARAAPKGGYVFVNWTESGSPVSTSSNFTFTLTGPRTLQAHFTAGWSIQATSSSPAGGTVTGAGGYPAGSNVTLVAQPSAGYRFTGWTEGGSLVGGSPTYSFAATTNRVIVGNFALIIPSLRMASAGAGDLWIEWPAALPGWVLQESPDLAPASWSNSTRAVSVSGTNHHVTVVPSGPRAFFRIIHP